jgi:tagaturonate epimerase
VNANFPVSTALQRSFAFGDRLGRATNAHIQASLRGDIVSVLAHQHIDEVRRTGRQPAVVRSIVQEVVSREHYGNAWAAGLHGLSTEQETFSAIASGFNFLSFDIGPWVDLTANNLSLAEVQARYGALCAKDQALQSLHAKYVEQNIEVSERYTLFADRATVERVVLKWWPAIRKVIALLEALKTAGPEPMPDVEISVSNLKEPTQALEHYFVMNELRDQGVPLVAFAPSLPEGFDRVWDFKGDVASLQRFLKIHVAIAYRLGPYKLTIARGDDKFSVLPVLSLICKDLLHVRTSGTSFLEGLRVVARKDPTLFNEILNFCVDHYHSGEFESLKSVPHHVISALKHTLLKDVEIQFLDRELGRQLLDSMYAPILSAGKRESGQPFSEAIDHLLIKHADFYDELLIPHLSRHIELLRPI